MRGVALVRTGEDVREIGQFVVGAQFKEQLERFVEHFVRPGVGAVDLVDDHNRLQPAFERLAQHEASLRHRAFGRIDEHQGSVGHVQHPLDLATEIGVARGIDEINLHPPIVDGDVFGQDRDAALVFQIIGVENTLAHQLARTVLAALAKHAIDQGCFAVIDVSNDRQVANIASAVGCKVFHL